LLLECRICKDWLGFQSKLESRHRLIIKLVARSVSQEDSALNSCHLGGPNRTSALWYLHRLREADRDNAWRDSGACECSIRSIDWSTLTGTVTESMKKSEGTKYAIFSKEYYDNWARPMACNRPMACKAGVETTRRISSGNLLI
jgi:hypothetical protein